MTDKEWSEIIAEKEATGEWRLYVEKWGDMIAGYRYGPDWKGMQLYVDGGRKTPEEAREEWRKEWERLK